MALALPNGLSPSKVDSFQSCPMAFRFSVIDRVPERPAVWTTKGTLVHRALELLHTLDGPDRSVEAALDALDRAITEMQTDPDWTGLDLDDAGRQQLCDDAERLVRRSFELEDHRTIRSIGLELKLEARVGDLVLRGIIDRLDLTDDGQLIVVDYKTGKVPSERFEAGKLGGVHFYAFLCEQVFGQRPAKVQLHYLAEPVAIVATPSEQSIRFLPKKAGAVWDAVTKACDREDFRPRTGPLCTMCAYKRWCPAFGGDPSRAVEEATAELVGLPA
ncbi:MAG: RecB family exonuclease [Acidimicrobiia bacterium]